MTEVPTHDESPRMPQSSTEVGKVIPTQQHHLWLEMRDMLGENLPTEPFETELGQCVITAEGYTFIISIGDGSLEFYYSDINKPNEVEETRISKEDVRVIREVIKGYRKVHPKQLHELSTMKPFLEKLNG